MALLIVLATSAIFTGSIYSRFLYASEYAESLVNYSFSVIEALMEWITTTQEDFECGSIQNVNTWSIPGDVILQKSPAWQSWWNSSWQYRMLINITDVSNTTLTDYQVLITLDIKIFNYSKANVEGSDIRFTFYNFSSNNESKLPYWIEEWNVSGESKIWVNIAEIPANGTARIYMYYGNPSAESESNGTATFIFFDDFETSLSWTENGLWHTTSKKWLSENNSKWYGQESTDNYDTGSANFGSLISPSFQAVGNAKLELWMWREVENFGWSGYDQTIIYDSSDNSTWNQIWYNDSANPSESAWKFLSISMTPNARYIRFYFNTVDELYNDYWGWFIDDVRIRKYIEPEPIVEMGAEESICSWIDYFGGKASVATIINANVSNGNVRAIAKKIIYDFNDVTSPSSTHTARFDVDDDYLEPATNFNTTGIEFSSANYASIYSSDNARAIHVTSLNGYKAQHIFRFKINVSESEIAKINVSWEGSCRYRLAWWWIPFTMYNGLRIWNFSSSNWDVIGDIPSGENVVSREYTNFYDYIDNGHIFLMAYAEYDARRVGISTDYVKVEVSYISPANITSVAISPLNLANWNKFYANATLPPGSDITYKILNATNNAMLCSITAKQAENGYNISFINASSIKLYAELIPSINGTPILHEWKVSWQTAYYENGYLISCPYYAGNATYNTISWNASLPDGTTIKFQIASSPDNINWTDFLGPDGSNDTYYNVSNTPIWSGHNGRGYIKYKAYFETTIASNTPVLHEVIITYYER